MKWKPLSGNAAKARDYACMAVCAPLIYPMVVLILLLIKGTELKREYMGPSNEWRPWLAWFPVHLGSRGTAHGQWVWLEWIERRALSLDNNEYRVKP